jgi:hypothetical protein
VPDKQEIRETPRGDPLSICSETVACRGVGAAFGQYRSWVGHVLSA